MNDTTYEHNPFTVLDESAGGSFSHNESTKNSNKSKQTMADSSAAKPKIKKNTGITYEDRIGLIQEYFGVSELCAIYLYHRRRRGVPWHKPSDPKYLDWSIAFQNALICLDTITGFDWRSLEFGYEEIQFVKNNIDLAKMPEQVIVLSEVQNIYMRNIPDKDGFIKVEHSKINITRELNKMGLIPRTYCYST